MAINRGPFNALVDDDNSGTKGTPWNKAQIQGVILDPVDAALAAIPTPSPPLAGTGGVWVPVPFDAANFWAGMTAAMVPVNKFMVIGNTMWWVMKMYNGVVPTPNTPFPSLVVPGGYGVTDVYSPVAFAFDGAPVLGVYLFPLAGNAITPSKIDNAPWSSYPMHLYFTAVLVMPGALAKPSPPNLGERPAPKE